MLNGKQTAIYIVIYLKNDLMRKFIFDTNAIGQTVPQGFNAIKIEIDGRTQADLDWNLAREWAFMIKEKGLHIFWEINLGLFEDLQMPLTNQSQFLSLCLSLEHFRDTLWKEFQEETIGLCLYRGSPDFHSHFKWDPQQISNFQGWLQESFENIPSFNREYGLNAGSFSEILPEDLFRIKGGSRLISLFCRDVIGEYLDLLAARLPDQLKCFLLFDCSGIEEPALLAKLVTKERYPRLNLGFKKGLGHGDELTWDVSGQRDFIGLALPPVFFDHEINHAICLPPMSLHHPLIDLSLNQAILSLKEFNVPFRLIPEVFLTQEWDRLDFLFVYSKNINLQGRRKLQGFCAAGGTVITLGECLGVPLEITFEEWLQNRLTS